MILIAEPKDAHEINRVVRGLKGSKNAKVADFKLEYGGTRRMSFRATQQQNPSAGELAIRCRLQKMGVHLLYDMVLLFYTCSFIVKRKDKLTQKEMQDKLIKKVFPDGLFDKVGSFYKTGKWIRFEFDGPAHKKSGVLKRDDEKDKLCKEYGIESHHFSFKPSGEQGIAEWRLTEICEAIREKVTK